VSFNFEDITTLVGLGVPLVLRLSSWPLSSHVIQGPTGDEPQLMITGAPGLCTIAGADLQDIAALDAAGARSCRYLEDLCHGMASVRKPLLAAVEGPAVCMTPREEIPLDSPHT
jgi:hypothetical protein